MSARAGRCCSRKGRPKSTQTTFFVPQTGQTVRIALDLEERGLGSGPPQSITPLIPMPSYQYHFVVLAKSPSRYSFIKIDRLGEVAVRRRIR